MVCGERGKCLFIPLYYRCVRLRGASASAQYETIHHLETNKLRNVAKFFAHLLFTDAIPWTVSLLSLVVVVVLEEVVVCYSRYNNINIKPNK